MNIYNVLQYTLTSIVFLLFCLIIGINKKTIDSLDNLNDLKKNINDIRGLIWANYAFITLSLLIEITIISNRYYKTNNWTIIFTLIFLALNTVLVIFEELTIGQYKEVDIVKLNNVYIITTIMNIVYFILFVVLTRRINKILKPRQYIIWDNINEED